MDVGCAALFVGAATAGVATEAEGETTEPERETTAATSHAVLAQAFLASLVIDLFLVGITEDGVGRLDLLEASFRFFALVRILRTPENASDLRTRDDAAPKVW